MPLSPFIPGATTSQTVAISHAIQQEQKAQEQQAKAEAERPVDSSSPDVVNVHISEGDLTQYRIKANLPAEGDRRLKTEYTGSSKTDYLQSQGLTPRQWAIQEAQARFPGRTIIVNGEVASRGTITPTQIAQTQQFVEQRQAEKAEYQARQEAGLSQFKGAVATDEIRGSPQAIEQLRSEGYKVAPLAESLSQMTPEKTQAIQKMLESPTAQFGTGAMQKGYDIVQFFKPEFRPSDVKATVSAATPEQISIAKNIETKYGQPLSEIDLSKLTQRERDLLVSSGLFTYEKALADTSFLTEGFYPKSSVEKASIDISQKELERAVFGRPKPLTKFEKAYDETNTFLRENLFEKTGLSAGVHGLESRAERSFFMTERQTYTDKYGYERYVDSNKVVNPFTLRNAAEIAYKFEKGMFEGIEEQPIVGVGSFLVGGAFGIGTKIASKVPILTKAVPIIKEIPVVGKYASPVAIGSTALAIPYGASVVERISTSKDKIEEAGRITSTELVPMVLGARAVEGIKIPKIQESEKSRMVSELIPGSKASKVAEYNKFVAENTKVSDIINPVSAERHNILTGEPTLTEKTVSAKEFIKNQAESLKATREEIGLAPKEGAIKATTAEEYNKLFGFGEKPTVGVFEKGAKVEVKETTTIERPSELSPLSRYYPREVKPETVKKEEKLFGEFQYGRVYPREPKPLRTVVKKPIEESTIEIKKVELTPEEMNFNLESTLKPHVVKKVDVTKKEVVKGRQITDTQREANALANLEKQIQNPLKSRTKTIITESGEAITYIEPPVKITARKISGEEVKRPKTEAQIKFWEERKAEVGVRQAPKKATPEPTPEEKSIAAYNKEVGEKITGIKSTKTVNVLDYLLVGSPRMVAPRRVGVRTGTRGLPSSKIGSSAYNRLTSARPTGGFEGKSPREAFRLERVKKIPSTLFGNDQSNMPSDMFAQATRDVLTQGEAQRMVQLQGQAQVQEIIQGQQQGQEQGQAQQQIQEQIQEQIQIPIQTPVQKHPQKEKPKPIVMERGGITPFIPALPKFKEDFGERREGKQRQTYKYRERISPIFEGSERLFSDNPVESRPVAPRKPQKRRLPSKPTKSQGFDLGLEFADNPLGIKPRKNNKKQDKFLEGLKI